MYKLYINKQLVFSSDDFYEASEIAELLYASHWGGKLDTNIN